MTKTKREYVKGLIELIMETDCAEEYLPFLEHELELLDSKRKSKVPTKVQKENESIMEFMTEEIKQFKEPMTITEMQKESELFREYSNQKISALFKKMIEKGQIEKERDAHGKTVFRYAETAAEE